MKNSRVFTQHCLSRRQNNAGFTLLELLVVIGIAVLLFTIIYASLNSARTKSNAARIVQDFQQLERAMLLFADAENILEWWEDESFGLGNDPTIKNLINNTTLIIFLSRPPSPPAGDGYRYNTVIGSYECDGFDPKSGVNLILTNVPSKYFALVDQIIDKGDGANCGRIGYQDTNLYYKLARSRDSY